MKINLTKEQYWNLIRATYMADWMANAICEEGMKKDGDIKEIRDYIFSFAKEMGFKNYVGYDEKIGYYAELDLDDEPSTRALIERYDEHSTWDELGGWLGKRDFHRKYSQKEIEKMTDEDRFMKLMECDIAWEKEFEEHGIERLGLANNERES